MKYEKSSVHGHVLTIRTQIHGSFIAIDPVNYTLEFGSTPVAREQMYCAEGSVGSGKFIIVHTFKGHGFSCLPRLQDWGSNHDIRTE